VDGCSVGGAQGVEDSERRASCGRRGREEQEGQFFFVDLSRTFVSCIFDIFSGNGSAGCLNGSEDAAVGLYSGEGDLGLYRR
jgi:hypothetical protein